jgi:eukaryotic-like serine/threonine-protein kinase
MKQTDGTPAQPRSARPPPQREERPPAAPAQPEPQVEDDYIGQLIDNRYLIEAIIGQGGMGVVYQCRHNVIGKKLAMKIIRADMAGAQEATQRFLVEAKAASAIGSEHIIHVSDFGQLPDGASYLVMELLEGTSLAAEFRDHWPLPIARIVSIAAQLAEGLGAAHRAGIVHRDLKPENIFLVPHGQERDFVKILDFGIAKMAGDAQLTRAGTVVGTPRYMSPEQAAGAVVDYRGDIYSLGVLLYELIAGRVPFDGEHPMSILTKHVYEAPPEFAAYSRRVQVPIELERTVWKCLAKQPEQRFASMEELAFELRRIGANDSASRAAAPRAAPDAPRPTSPTEATATVSSAQRADPSPRRALRVALYAALAALALASFWMLAQGGAEPPAPAASPASPPVAPAPAAPAASPAVRLAPPEAEAEPTMAEPPPPAAAAPKAARGADAKAARRPVAKPRARRSEDETEFVNPYPASR